jgi:hypothetical protein
VVPLVGRYQSCRFSFTILQVIILSPVAGRIFGHTGGRGVEERFSAAFQKLFSIAALAVEVTTIA